jgi:hypothetical protein
MSQALAKPEEHFRHDLSESLKSIQAKQSRWRDWQAKQLDSFNKSLHRPSPGSHTSQVSDIRWSDVRPRWFSPTMEHHRS